MNPALRTRLVTAAVLVPLVILAVLYLPRWGFALLVSVLMLAAFWEWTRLSGMAARQARAGVAALLALLFLGYYLLPHDSLRAVALNACGFWLLAAVWLRNAEFATAETPAHRVLKLAAGAIVLSGAWAGAVYLRDGLPADGPLWLLACLTVVYSADSLAYFTGRRFGGRKLAPRISPGKTWAGLYGAVAGVVPIALTWGWLLGLRGQRLGLWLILALACVLLSVLGDLFESLMKRHSQVKDSGRLFPGHGGVLDRGDSLFAALPAFAAGLAWLLAG